MRAFVFVISLLGGAWFGQTQAAQPPSASKPVPTAMVAYRWFSLPITVSRVPVNAEYLPVSVDLDFADALRKLNEGGSVDPHSLRLFRLDAGPKVMEEPYQWTPRPQPRSGSRRLLTGTTDQVSYLGEYAADEKPPAEIHTAGRLTWIVSSQNQGRRRYRLRFGIPTEGRLIQVPYAPRDLHVFDNRNRATSQRWFPRMQIRPQQPLDGSLSVYADQALMTTYRIGPTLSEGRGLASPYRRPFLYPVNGPHGVTLTEFGKPHDPTGSHAHHNSLWIAHAQVNGQDFWSERGGRIVHESIEEIEDGPIFCRLVQKTRWMAKDTALVRERRRWTFYAIPDRFRLIDLDLEFTPAGPSPVTFGKTSFGFLAVRVAQSLSPFDGGGEIVNAQGQRNEQEAHLQRAPWLDQSGPIGADRWEGVTLFDHPDNPHYPTVWHCRNDGWAGAAFNRDEPYRLEPDQALQLRYRILLHRGDSVRGQVARRFAEWTAQPSLKIGELVRE